MPSIYIHPRFIQNGQEGFSFTRISDGVIMLATSTAPASTAPDKDGVVAINASLTVRDPSGGKQDLHFGVPIGLATGPTPGGLASQCGMMNGKYTMLACAV
eukprot:gene10149-1832_t